jgi:hypothetical protein
MVSLKLRYHSVQQLEILSANVRRLVFRAFDSEKVGWFVNYRVTLARRNAGSSARHGYRTPAQVRADQRRLDPDAVDDLQLAAESAQSRALLQHLRNPRIEGCHAAAAAPPHRRLG